MPVYRYDCTTGRILKSHNPKGRWKWRYNFTIEGKRYSGVCHGAQTKKQAEDIEAEMKRRVVFGTYGKPDGATTFENYARGPFMRWSKAHKRTWTWDELHVEILCEYFGKKALTEITRADVEAYQLKRRDQITQRKTQRSGASVNRERSLLSAILNRAVADGYIEQNPCIGVKRFKEYGRRERVMSHEEQRTLLDALTGDDAWLLPIVRIDLGAAMRRGELLKFRVEHLDFDNDLINLPGEITKNGKPRTIPMNADVRAVLIDLRGNKASVQGKVFRERPDRVSQRFNLICDRLKMPDLVFHCLRHTTITRWAENGMSPFVIQMIAGHSSLSQTNHYAHVSLAELRRAVKMLETGAKSSDIVQMGDGNGLNVADNSMANGNLQTQLQNA